jgi:hypothetical protein
MSDVNRFKGIKGVADAYVQMRQKEAEVAQAQVTATTVVETETTSAPADAKVQPEQTNETNEEVVVEAAPAYKQTSKGKKLASTSFKEEDDAEDEKKSKKKVTINPELAEDGHTDVSSAMRKCKTVAEDAAEILTALQSMNPEDSLPSWWMNAMAVSANEMNQLRDYIKNPKEE